MKGTERSYLTMKTASGKIFYLDGIRGLAAFCVFLHHFGLAFHPAYFNGVMADSHLSGWDVWYGKSVFSFLTSGSFCVHIFFILSGYVLSRKYFKTEDVNVLVAAAQKRYLRLYIPVGVTIVLAYILMISGAYFNVAAGAITHSEDWLGSFWLMEHPFREFLKSLLYGTMLLGNNSFDTTLWTMSIELFGSMLVFALLALTHNTRRKLISFLVFGLVLILINKTLYTCFVLGIALNYVERNLEKVKKYSNLVIVILMMSAGLLLGSYHEGHIEGTIYDKLPAGILALKNTFHILGGFLFILSVMLSTRLQAFFSLRPLRFLGLVSFSLYLIHPLVIGSFSSFLFLQLHEAIGYNLAVLFVFVLTTLLVLWLSNLMAIHIDLKGMRFSGRFFEKHFKTPDK